MGLADLIKSGRDSLVGPCSGSNCRISLVRKARLGNIGAQSSEFRNYLKKPRVFTPTQSKTAVITKSKSTRSSPLAARQSSGRWYAPDQGRRRGIRRGTAAE